MFVAIAHTGGSSLWVASTVLWQKHVEDAYRGRVFVLEFLAMDVSFALGGLLGGAVYDATGSLAHATWIVSALVLALGGAWTWLARGFRGPGLRIEVVPASEEAD